MQIIPRQWLLNWHNTDQDTHDLIHIMELAIVNVITPQLVQQQQLYYIHNLLTLSSLLVIALYGY